MGADSASSPTTNRSTEFIESILHSAVDLANARSSKILLTRTDIHAELNLDQFVAVYDSAWQFILWSEALVGRVVGSLRGVVVSQVSLSWIISRHILISLSRHEPSWSSIIRLDCKNPPSSWKRNSGLKSRCQLHRSMSSIF
jgi:hypothetical protein